VIKNKSKRLFHSVPLVILFVTLASFVFIRAAIVTPPWMRVGVGATWTWREYDEGMATPVTTTYSVQVTGTFDDPFDPYCIMTRTILGILADVIQVYYANGDWLVYLPPERAFAGAMTETINIPGYGDVQCYRLPQSFNGMSGNAYYDKTTGWLVQADLAQGSYYLRVQVNTASSGLITAGGPAPTPKHTLTVLSDRGNPSGGGSYDSGTTVYARISESRVSSSIIQDWVFTGWSGDASGTGTTSEAIVMTSNKTAIANWVLQYNTTFYILIAVVAVAAIGVIIFLIRR
jgi:hypothetical protein